MTYKHNRMYKKMYRKISHNAAFGAFSSKGFDFERVIIIISLLTHSNERM